MRITSQNVTTVFIALTITFLGLSLIALRATSNDDDATGGSGGILGLRLKNSISSSSAHEPCPLVQNETPNDNVEIQIPHLQTISVPTNMRSEPIPVTIALPYSNQPPEEKEQLYSTLYLLHGAGNDYAAWSNHVNLTSIAAKYNLVIICPDGGITSWYFDSPLDPSYQYETFISHELIKYIDANYPTRPNPKHRAIMGNSMGGHGAFFLSLRHADIFGTAVALSGGVDLRPFPKQWDIAKRIGTIEEYPEVWEELSVVTQVGKYSEVAKNLNLAMDCGTNDFFLGVNRNLHQILLDLKVEHDYMERPGGHSWGYWERVIHLNMPFIHENINGA